MQTSDHLFPIMDLGNANVRHQVAELRAAGVPFVVVAVPWAMLARHGRQAEVNHHQTLERLAERGGLGAQETVAILENRAYDLRRLTLAEAHRRLHELVLAWYAAEHAAGEAL